MTKISMQCAVRCSWYATQLRSTMRSHTFIGHRSTAKKFVPRRHCQPLNSFGQERPPPRQSRQTCATLHKRRTCGAEMFVAGTRTALLPTYATTISPLATRWPLSPHRRAPRSWSTATRTRTQDLHHLLCSLRAGVVRNVRTGIFGLL